MAYAASKATKIEKMPITKNDLRRPMVFISSVTGGMVTAVPTTILATGSVARFSSGASFVPTKPPAKTTSELTESNSAWEMVSIHTLRGRLFILIFRFKKDTSLHPKGKHQ